MDVAAIVAAMTLDAYLTAHQLNLHFVHLLQQGGRRGGPLTRSTVNAHAIQRALRGEGGRRRRSA